MRARADRCRRVAANAARGYALLAALLLVALFSLATTAAVEHAALQAQREREAELLFIGTQYQRAIASYYAAVPLAQRRYPVNLDDLLEDKRFPRPLRHLRRAWRDPITGGEWVAVRAQGRVVGVHSAGTGAPLKRTRFPAEFEDFADAASYADWRFLATGVSAKQGDLAAAPPLGDPTNPDPPAAPSPAEPPPPQATVPSPPSQTAPPPSAEPRPPDERLSQCAVEHGRRLALCYRLDAAGEERRTCIGQSSRLYGACLAGR